MLASLLPDTPPPIQSLEELMTRAELAEMFEVAERTVDGWRYGKIETGTPLPYFRCSNRIWLWRGGVLWWLNQIASTGDAYYRGAKQHAKDEKRVNG